MRPRIKAPNGRTVQARLLSNVIGDRGENAFELAITDYRQFNRPLFKPGFLGEKWPAIDYYVELQGIRNAAPFFFAQVKATAANLGARTKTIAIQADKTKTQNLFKVPGPTYVVGVHEPSGRAFILSLHKKPSKGIYRIPIKYELTPANLKRLYDEVALFWKSASRKPTGSYFT